MRLKALLPLLFLICPALPAVAQVKAGPVSIDRDSAGLVKMHFSDRKYSQVHNFKFIYLRDTVEVNAVVRVLEEFKQCIDAKKTPEQIRAVLSSCVVRLDMEYKSVTLYDATSSAYTYLDRSVIQQLIDELRKFL